MHASAPTNVLAGVREGCSLPRLQLRRLTGGLGKGLRDANFRSLPVFSGWSPLCELPPLVPAPPAPLRRTSAAGEGCCPVAQGSCGPFEGLTHALFLSPGGIATHPMNQLPLSHLSRASGCISRFQEQLRNFLGPRASPAVRTPLLTLCLLNTLLVTTR